MLNYSELKSKVAILAQRSDDADFIAKIGVWLNLGIDFLVDVYDYYVELNETYSFQSVDGQEAYPLPNNFEKPLRLYDIDNDLTLTPISEEEYIDGNVSNIANATEGVPDKYRITGISGTRVQVSTDRNSVV